MRGTWLIFRKEIMEFFKDRKTVFFTLVLPILLYPAIFSMMTKLAKGDSEKRKSRPSRVVLMETGAVLRPMLVADPKLFEVVPAPEGDLKQAILDQKVDLAITVEPAAEAKLARQETFDVTTLVDESESSSRLALKRLKEGLKKQDEAWVKARLEAAKASPALAAPTKLVEAKASTTALEVGKQLGAMLPYILILTMYAGAMQHGAYLTAGEKERGTLLSLLSTRLSRRSIIRGKLLMVFAIGLGSALASISGFILGFTSIGREIAASEPATQGMGQASAMANLTNPTSLLLTLLLIIPVGLLLSAVILLLGTQAKNTREATMAMTPGIFVVMGLGLFSSAPGVDKMAFLPWVPVVNVSLAIRKLFGGQAVAWEYAVALGMTLVLAALTVTLATRMLDREEALFKV